MSPDTEAEVLRTVSQLLATHPSVGLAIRLNSGMTRRNGAPVWFHKLVKGRGVAVDFIGYLRTKPFALECKRPSWEPGKASGPTGLRETEQARFLEGVRELGGVAGFVRSMDEARAVLEGRH